MLYEHHREPGKLDAPALCAGATSLSGQPIAEQAAPARHPRPTGPQKECLAAKRRCVLASCGSSALRCRTSRLAAACRLRQSGRRIVAPSPFHAPAVPFAAAAIPPHSQATLNPLHPPRPAAFCGRALRLSPPVSPAKRRAIVFNQPDHIHQSRPPHPETPD